VKTKRELQRRDHAGQVYAVTFSRDWGLLATASDDGCVRIWDRAMEHELGRFTHDGEVHTIAFAPDGKTLAAAGDAGMIALWKTAQSRLKKAQP